MASGPGIQTTGLQYGLKRTARAKYGYSTLVCTILGLLTSQRCNKKLYLRVEFSVFIASVFEWQLQSDSNAMLEADSPATVDIQMTLTDRMMDIPNVPRNRTLEDAAFRPKTYKLTVERRDDGFLVSGRTHYGCNPKYRYRLLWDVSPYPPLEEWRAKAPARANKFWEWNDFYCNRIGEEDGS